MKLLVLLSLDDVLLVFSFGFLLTTLRVHVFLFEISLGICKVLDDLLELHHSVLSNISTLRLIQLMLSSVSSACKLNDMFLISQTHVFSLLQL